MSTTVNSTTTSDFVASLQKRASTSSTTTTDAQSKFLTLLTEQLKNQDPLNPMDNAQMTSQLAQISTVDGIEKLNTTLTSLLQDSQSNAALQAAALVGQNVMVAGKDLTLSGSKGYGGIELPSAADKVTVTIKDANGLQVRKLELGARDAGVSDFAWDGTTDSGSKAVDGAYTISVTASRGDTALKPVALELTKVGSVLRTASGGVSLDVGNGSLVSLSDIKQIL
ncbi:MAG TPA: flagellar hook assembly protein FlgD [Rhodocyclaceae bacterium]|nr:flagellar hook assembly protein FlgD [Rhodocyclaceae bacterium]HNC80415.1 flagellar hook assembly protein FlgD [Rhodocyclaceae bacterium]